MLPFAVEQWRAQSPNQPAARRRPRGRLTRAVGDRRRRRITCAGSGTPARHGASCSAAGGARAVGARRRPGPRAGGWGPGRLLCRLCWSDRTRALLARGGWGPTGTAAPRTEIPAAACRLCCWSARTRRRDLPLPPSDPGAEPGERFACFLVDSSGWTNARGSPAAAGWILQWSCAPTGQHAEHPSLPRSPTFV